MQRRSPDPGRFRSDLKLPEIGTYLADVTSRRNATKRQSGAMSPIVDENALDEFLERADATEAYQVSIALDAMAASVRLRAVELETRRPVDFTPRPVSVRGR